MTIILLLFVMTTTAIVLSLFSYFYVHYVLKQKEKDLDTGELWNNWQEARGDRIIWRVLHIDDVTFDFFDPEYQQLWDIEIGAEDCYLHRINWPRKNTSWQEYLEEKRFHQQETSG